MSKIEEIGRGYFQAEETRDPERIMEFFAPEATWTGPGISRKGHAEIREIYGASAAAFPRLTVDVGRVLGSELEAAFEWDATFYDTNGNVRRIAGANIIRTDGERIVSLVTHHNPADLADPGSATVAVGARHAGKRVLVTGAGGGIGAAIAAQFVAEGAYVVGVDLSEDGLRRQASELGEHFRPVVADITEPSGRRLVIDAASSHDGVLDVLVNNAAVFLLAGVDATQEQWQRTLEVNLLGPAYMTAEAADALGRASCGAVVNIASVSGHIAQANRWTYNAAKGGVLELTRCQALDLAPRGIRVNSISPGFVWTDVLDRAAQGDRARWEKIWGAYTLVGRCAEPSEVAAAAAFLASDEASYMTGTDIRVDGGYLAIGPEGGAAYDFNA